MDIELGKKNVDPEIQDIQKKRLKLSLAKKNRFVYKQKEEMETICKGYVPPNTEKNTNWALKCLNEWRYARNEKSSEKCPDDLLEAQVLARSCSVSLVKKVLELVSDVQLLL